MAEQPAASGQGLIGFLSNDEWAALLADLNARIEQIEQWPDGDARREVFELLNGIDTLHREALRRLVRLFKDGVLEQVVTDPAIHTLMELYDLLPEQDTTARKAFPTIPIRPVRPAPAPSRYPHWLPVADAGEVAPGSLLDDVEIDGHALLLVRRDAAEWYALDAACALDGASLQGATLNGYTLTCPAHAGCHYDIRNGARIGGGAQIACHPVRCDDDGRVQVGVGIEFRPNLPSF